MTALRPIGTKIKILYNPSNISTEFYFNLFEYEIIGHSEYIAKIGGPKVGTGEELRALSHVKIIPLGGLQFCGQWWYIPPKNVWEFALPGYKDILHILALGIVKPSVWYGDPVDLTDKKEISSSDVIIENLKQEIFKIKKSLNAESEEAAYNGSYQGGLSVRERENLLSKIDKILENNSLYTDPIQEEIDLIASYLDQNLFSNWEYATAIRERRYLNSD